MGFKPNESKLKFMDWYFDVPSILPLCTRDCWLRYRHLSETPTQGSWQLKMGKTVNNGDSSTVYEELEGDDALDSVESMFIKNALPKGDVPSTDEVSRSKEMDGYLVPELPRLGRYGLKPFARIETMRSSWKIDQFDNAADANYKDITIDLDATDYGYTVGEVELVVRTNDEISMARDRVQAVIRQVSDDGSSRALGKLETYLIENKKEIYDACVKAGSL